MTVNFNDVRIPFFVSDIGTHLHGIYHCTELHNNDLERKSKKTIGFHHTAINRLDAPIFEKNKRILYLKM